MTTKVSRPVLKTSSLREVGYLVQLDNLGDKAAQRGDYEQARTYYQEALGMEWTLGNVSGISGLTHSLLGLGDVALQQGEYEQAMALYEESLALSRQVGARSFGATILLQMSGALYTRGEHERAAACAEEAVGLARDAGEPVFAADGLRLLANARREQGAHALATALYTESLHAYRNAGYQEQRIVECLEGMASLAAAVGQAARAARLWGVTAATRAANGQPLPPSSRAFHARAVTAGRATLGDEAFAAAWAEGQALSLEQTVRLALEPDV